MQLKEIYRPIEKELTDTTTIIRNSLEDTSYESISEINNYILDAGGKKIRPILLLLSAKAACQASTVDGQMTKIAAAIELIHRASLIHDDVIDRSRLRYNKPTINSKWGSDVSIALGDYLYSVAFELISKVGNKDIFECVSLAAKAMCEGELLQVCERNNLDLLKERYIIIVKKKTASLFIAACHAGALISNTSSELESALKEYGLNFGIAFQIIDDYLDLVGDEKNLGKSAGQDIKAGEMTLPAINLLESAPPREREEIKRLLGSRRNNETLKKIRKKLFKTSVTMKIKETACFYLTRAAKRLDIMPNSVFKESLIGLTDFIIQRGFTE